MNFDFFVVMAVPLFVVGTRAWIAQRRLEGFIRWTEYMEPRPVYITFARDHAALRDAVRSGEMRDAEIVVALAAVDRGTRDFVVTILGSYPSSFSSSFRRFRWLAPTPASISWASVPVRRYGHRYWPCS
jgi:hypothetical protein